MWWSSWWLLLGCGGVDPTHVYCFDEFPSGYTVAAGFYNTFQRGSVRSTCLRSEEGRDGRLESFSGLVMQAVTKLPASSTAEFTPETRPKAKKGNISSSFSSPIHFPEVNSPVKLQGCTLPETNSSPLKIGRAPKRNSSSNHQFSGASC